MREFRLNGWQRIGIWLSVLWAISASQWFMLNVPSVNDPGISSVYLQSISQPRADHAACQDRAEGFSKEAHSEFLAAWSWIVLAPIIVIWALVYIVVWAVRWIGRGFQPSSS